MTVSEDVEEVRSWAEHEFATKESMMTRETYEAITRVLDVIPRLQANYDLAIKVNHEWAERYRNSPNAAEEMRWQKEATEWRLHSKRLAESLKEVRDELTNLQPHIPDACYPGREKFIDSHVDVALGKITAALGVSI